MKEEKWIYDIHAKELINLKDCKGIWIHRDRPKTENIEAQYTLQFGYYGKSKGVWLHYESSKLLHNAFAHYTSILGCKELDVSTKPVTL